MRCGKIVCVGQNYRAHVKEMSSEEPAEPVLFLKPCTSLIEDGKAILIPPGIGTVHHEVELALIIGRPGKDITPKRALQHVRSVAVFNDVTARDVQSTARKAGLPWALSKGMDTFAPMSDPVPLREVGDLHVLELELRVNDELRQKGNTSQMIFPPEQLISYISRYMTLERGDIIATGTPSGVGPLRPGDQVVATISGVGTMANPVRAQSQKRLVRA
ncbi:MAG: fumarylacetoacetate hydrolase family protein [Methanomassiliicoccales archaeon]|nr:fumarylacetoacetate hydrolase family protein [Methanomassiliicoccales archaeon]